MQDSVLVTGGVGFIGSHLVKRLVEKGLSVVVPYREIDPRSVFVQNELGKKTIAMELDITQEKELSDLIQKYEVSHVFHLAAQTLVTTAYDHPVETVKDNVMGTASVLEAVRQNPSVRGVIVASSDKAYGKTQTAYTESTALLGDHPYDASKASADLLSQAYYRTYKMPVVVTRFGNVYGEGDLHFDRLIPGICKAIIDKKMFEIRSDGTYVRDYLYVQDVIDGYLTLLDHIDGIHGQAYNFSSSDTLSVLDLIGVIEKTLGEKIQYEIRNNAKNEIPYQHLDDAKIKKLGWESKYRLENTIGDILSWYQKVLSS